MEIERKWLISAPPADLESYPHHLIEQGYLCTAPVVRIRREDEEYTLTYKGDGLLARTEYNLPLTREAYEHLRTKIDGRLISKTRYRIPAGDGLTVELDHFHSPNKGLFLAEIEFKSVEEALAHPGLPWFAEDVTNDPAYHNSVMSGMA